MNHKEIALVKETRQGAFIGKIMDSIAPHLTLKSSDRVAIKINLSGAREIYANTHYETVQSLIDYIKKHFGVSRFAVVEGSEGAYHAGKTTWDIFYKFKYKEVELNGAQLVNLDDLPHDKTLTLETLSGPRDIRFASVEADYTIIIAPPKTHNVFPVSLSIPSITGFVEPEHRAFILGASFAEQRRFNYNDAERFARLIHMAGRNTAKLLREINPSMALIDGLYGMEGKGPVKGSPVFHGFSVASEDLVLVDSLATFIMGFDVSDVSYLHYAHLEGLGQTRWERVVGVDPLQVKFPYRPHPLYNKQKQWRRLDPQSGQNGSGRNQGNRNPGRNRDHRPHPKNHSPRNES